MASLVSFITSSGVCPQAGGGWGGLRLAMLDDENEEVSNMPDNADDVEKRRVITFRLGWTKRGVGAIKCLNPAIDLMVTCGSRRVVAKPKARPTAKRPQFRRGRRHLVTLELELERATAYMRVSGSEDNARVACLAQLSFLSPALPTSLDRVSLRFVLAFVSRAGTQRFPFPRFIII